MVRMSESYLGPFDEDNYQDPNHPNYDPGGERVVDLRAEKKPHLFMQTKGTDICADFLCSCGMHGHYDTDFLSHTRCPKCGAVYRVNYLIELTLMTPDEVRLKERWFNGDAEENLIDWAKLPDDDWTESEYADQPAPPQEPP